MNEPTRKPIIKASEVAQFCYCPVAWHLQRKGYKPESSALDFGVETHKNLGIQIGMISKREKGSKWLQWLGVCILVFAFLSLFIVFTTGEFAVGITFYILLIAGIIMISISRYRYRRISKAKRELGIPEGKIVYTDLDKPAEPLFSKHLWLTGKPDYIVKTGLEYIPVEAKTTVADEPYRNHIMQLASYCLLLEEEYGQVILFGVIAYGDGRQFKIPLTETLRKDILDTLDKMRFQLRAVSVVRDHNSVAKCKLCSFRQYCPQSVA
jgi:CRISPR-associated exonuclease Cas4